MKYLKIQNDGILDIRLVALMGGTTKSKDKYKIGQFGTGLKYTLAYLYRNNLDFKIFSGTEEINLSLENEVIRDQKFEIICINGHRTSITTQMGEEWTAWMIIREIWCNALDEGGSVKEVTDEVIGTEGTTTFYIQVNGAVEEVLKNWGTYFIHGQEALFESADYSIYPGGDSVRLYKNGVLIYEDKHHKALFSYDSHTADINELREFRGAIDHQIVQALCKANERVATYFYENISDKYFEGESCFDYDWYCSWSSAWKNVLGKAKLIHTEAVKIIEAKGISIDLDSLVIVPKSVYKFLTQKIEGIGSLVVASRANEFYESHNEQMADKLKQGLVILESCDYVMHPELVFVYGFFEDKSCLAKVNLKEKKVYISNTLLARPLFCIVAMLIEENEHFNTGMTDESRAFQQHFIDLYARQLLATNEIEI